jgi:hypothetical protein
MWMELAIVFGIFSIGNVLFGHFELHTPPARRVAKQVLFVAITALIYLTAGRPWSWLWLALPLLAAVYVHAIVLPRRGINGLTGEPKARYYAMRGWKYEGPQTQEQTS